MSENRSTQPLSLEDQRKIAAYDAARTTVKIEGNTRAFYVLRAEALESAMRIVWFKSILPALDYEVKGGTWDEPRWAWQQHSWFRLLGLTDEECVTSLQSPELHRSEVDEIEEAKA